jgi:rod shape determining protein RodA
MGRILRGIDGIMMAVLTGISCFGLFILLSINQELFWEHLGFLIVSLVVILIISRFDGLLLQYLSPYLYIISICLLGATFLFPEIRGAARWIPIGPFQLQPSELVKPFMLLAFASFMSHKSPRKVKNIPLLVFLFAIPFFIIFRQPDLGTSIVYFSGWSAMMFAGGIPIALIILAVIISAIAAPIGWNLLERFQQLRILTFLNPAFDPSGAGYNAYQAMIAVGSGQLLGRGLGRGTQSHLRFLPEFHTDFIFATLVEELGFIGGFLLILLYGYLLWRIIRPLIKQEETNDVSYFYAVGVFAMIFTQVIVNVGMNIGIIPITGITLPLISSGGSSLISLGIMFGILFALRKV